MQVYKYFDIGTAKLSHKDRERIPHHLIDFLEPDEEFTAFDFKTRALEHIRKLIERNKVPVMAGGTGLYLKVLCEDYDCAVQIDPEIKEQIQLEIKDKGLPLMYKELQQIDPASAERIQPADTQRIERALSIFRQTGKTLSAFIDARPAPEYEFPIHTFLIERDRKELYTNINHRVDRMMEAGWIDEVKSILARGYAKTLKPFQGIGYAQIVNYLDGKLTLERTVELIKRDTRHYAKRQTTWFKKVRGAQTVSADSSDTAETLREKILSALPQAAITFILALGLALGYSTEATADSNNFASALYKFKKGEYSQAALLFRSVQKTGADSTEAKQALYLLGHSLAQANEPEKAIEVFQSAIESYPAIEDYIRYHLAHTYQQSGKNTEALEQILTLLEKFPQTLLYAQAQLVRAEALESKGENEDALKVLSEATKHLSGYPPSSRFRLHLPEFIYQRGRLLQQSGKNTEAFTQYRELYIGYPTHELTEQAEQEMGILRKVPDIAITPFTTDENVRRLGRLLKEVRHKQVVQEITKLEAKQSPLPGQMYFYLANAQKGLRKRNLANAALRKFIKLYPQHARTQEGLFRIGRNLWNTGRYQDGLKYFEKSIETAPRTRWAQQARFFIGKMHEEKRHYPQAVKHYKTLIERFGDNEYAERASWQLGWLYHRTGDFQKAFEHFMENARRYPGGLFIESSMFWAAKSAENLGRVNLAQQLYKDSSNRFPYTYYGIRAKEKWKRDKSAGTENIGNKKSSGSVLTKKQNLSASARFHHIRAVELSATGFYEDARFEIRQVEKSVPKTLSGVMWLAALYNNAHAYPETMRIMQLYKDFKTKIHEKELNGEFWKHFYPLAYAETISANSNNQNVDPYFVKGLIRQESLFDAQVQSPAGAIGLMQIMPTTGRALYSKTKKNEPFSTDFLFDPEANIQLGVRYISQLSRKFDENMIYILISYNAGPNALKKWLKRFHHIDDPDVFIESIPYPETRKYVKKVLRNYGIYQALYPKANTSATN